MGFTSAPQPVGNRTQEAREDGDLRIWTYDPTNQLISEQRTEGESWSALTADQWDGMGVNDWGLLPALSAAGPITTYVYDPVGNRLVLNVDGELTTSTYDAANRLVNAEDVNGITTYTFDANGNQRTVETPANEMTTYSWTYENQLSQLEEPDDVVTTYVYAPTNRRGEELRLVKETDAGIINYIWDDQNIIQEVDGTNAIEAEYTLNPQAYGNLISQRRDGDSTFYHYDALGSTQSLTDQTGTVENEYTYGAFGQELSSSGSVDNPFTWVGELGYYKEEDGRYTLRRREYDEGIARFLSEDPIRFDAGDENLYRYTQNSPLNSVDPSGLEHFSYNKQTNGKYAVYYVPENWIGINQAPIFVGYTDIPGGTWFTLPKSKVERPGYCSLMATQFVSEAFPSDKSGWDEFFRRKCAEVTAAKGTAPADSIVDAPQMCTGSAPGATSPTCAAGFVIVPATISLFLSRTITSLILEYFPLGGAGIVVQKVAMRCTPKGRVLKLFIKGGCKEAEELSEEATEKLLKNLQKKQTQVTLR